MIGLRDPVDRFLSSYYWRRKVACDPRGGDARTTPPKRGIRVASYPDLYCRDSFSDREMDVLFFRYSSDDGKDDNDIENLARALCSTNATVARRAHQSVQAIGHAQHTITEWLGQNWTAYSEAMYPLVLEQSFDFEKQVEDAFNWARQIGCKVEKPAARDEGVNCTNSQVTKDSAGQDNNGDDDSSLSLHSASNVKRPLSETGERCIARYYADDYRILQEIREAACKSDTCKRAIQSILDRRMSLLQS